MTMEYTFNGRFPWHGIFIDEDGEESPFVVFADTIEQAVKDADMPGEIVMLAREKEIPDDKRTFTVDNPGLEKKIDEVRKRKIN